jgi:hypothetical protein
VKAIETRYKGFRFRSRLEARWAVFFDALGVKWDYEPEGFEFADGTRYLPDFWLPDHGVWVEVKPTPPTPREQQLALELLYGSGRPVYITGGGPGSLGELHVTRTANGGEVSHDIVQRAAILKWEHTAQIQFRGCGTTRGVVECDQLGRYQSGAGGISRIYCQAGTDLPLGAHGLDEYDRAIVAARSARFEHGESGAVL